MNLKKKLLPLAFLGLSPAAHATTPAQTQNSGAQKTKTETVVKKTVQSIPKDTIKLDIAAFAREETDSTDMQHIDMLVEAYNKRPLKFHVADITKLLEIMQNPTYLYSQLKMPLTHARYIYDNLSPQALKRLNIKNRMEIIANSVNKTVYNISANDAYLIMNNVDLAPLVVASHDALLNSALDVALKKPKQLTESNTDQNIIHMSLQYATSHADLDISVSLYMRIFNTATHMIQAAQLSDSTKTDEVKSIHWISMEIDIANHKIPSGSKMDKTIAVRIPSQAVVSSCQAVYSRLILADLYNRAYFSYMQYPSTTPPNGLAIPVSKTANKIFMDYLNILYLQEHASRVENGKQKLNELLTQYPEVALFQEYFSVAYLNFNNGRNTICDYAATLMTDKKKKPIAMPRAVSDLLTLRQQKLSAPRGQMRSYDIMVPDFTPKTQRMTYTGYTNSDMALDVIFETIKNTLRQQIDVVMSQERTAKQLLKLQRDEHTSQNLKPTHAHLK